jgi:hypothetical protein
MMYRRQLREQLQDHFQAYASLSESRIPAVHHQIRFCRYTTEYNYGDIVVRKDDAALLLPQVSFGNTGAHFTGARPSANN